MTIPPNISLALTGSFNASNNGINVARDVLSAIQGVRVYPEKGYAEAQLKKVVLKHTNTSPSTSITSLDSVSLLFEIPESPYWYSFFVLGNPDGTSAWKTTKKFSDYAVPHPDQFLFPLDWENMIDAMSLQLADVILRFYGYTEPIEEMIIDHQNGQLCYYRFQFSPRLPNTKGRVVNLDPFERFRPVSSLKD